MLVLGQGVGGDTGFTAFIGFHEADEGDCRGSVRCSVLTPRAGAWRISALLVEKGGEAGEGGDLEPPLGGTPDSSRGQGLLVLHLVCLGF